jgi:predicted Fe-Mo cluster-binding NifX family protein
MIIRIVVSSQDDTGLSSRVSEHFGRCPYFTLVELEDQEIKSSRAIDNPYAQNHAPGQVPEFIHRLAASVMLTGGMGYRAVSFFEGFGIDVATGAAGTVEEAVQNYLAGKLRGASPCAESQHHHGHESLC